MLISASKDAPVGTFPMKLVAVGRREASDARGRTLAGDKAARQGFVTIVEAAPFAVELVTLSAVVEQRGRQDRGVGTAQGRFHRGH